MRLLFMRVLRGSGLLRLMVWKGAMVAMLLAEPLAGRGCTQTLAVCCSFIARRGHSASYAMLRGAAQQSTGLSFNLAVHFKIKKRRGYGGAGHLQIADQLILCNRCRAKPR